MKYGLIGEKLGHSFSVEIHGKIADYTYELLELAPDELEDFFREKAFSAINVTIPYKEKVIPYLHSISPVAETIGAVNTVVNRDGLLLGYNTDYYGATAMIEQAGITVKGKKALILGTGGTAKTLFAVLRDMGAKEAVFVSRSKSEVAITYDEVFPDYVDTEILVNTTPVGMYPNTDAMPIDLDGFTHLEGVVDVIYNPLATKLVQTAQKKGIKATGGLYMLAAQGVYASSLFLDKPLDCAIEQRVYRSVLQNKQNIVLIGMPSSGKTTVGKAVAKALGRPFFDSDKEIVKKAGKTIPAIFAEEGEAHFRALEREVIASLSKHSGAVIATGGGAVLSKENIDRLRQNGILFFLDRSLEKLTPTGDRPLSQSRDALRRRYEERYPLYCRIADKIIPANGSVKEVTKTLIEEFSA